MGAFKTIGKGDALLLPNTVSPTLSVLDPSTAEDFFNDFLSCRTSKDRDFPMITSYYLIKINDNTIDYEGKMLRRDPEK